MDFDVEGDDHPFEDLGPFSHHGFEIPMIVQKDEGHGFVGGCHCHGGGDVSRSTARICSSIRGNTDR